MLKLRLNSPCLALALSSLWRPQGLLAAISLTGPVGLGALRTLALRSREVRWHTFTSRPERRVQGSFCLRKDLQAFVFADSSLHFIRVARPSCRICVHFVVSGDRAQASRRRL